MTFHPSGNAYGLNKLCKNHLPGWRLETFQIDLPKPLAVPKVVLSENVTFHPSGNACALNYQIYRKLINQGNTLVPSFVTFHGNVLWKSVTFHPSGSAHVIRPVKLEAGSCNSVFKVS